MSFGTRVRISHERNNREVIATVDDRIPPSDPRITDISKEAGDAIRMAQTGYPRMRLEELIPERPAAAPAALLGMLLYMRRVPWGPWYYPVWLRRHLRYLKKRVY
jgi:rare lipoprotein A (peptidoglycan hydrolase)